MFGMALDIAKQGFFDTDTVLKAVSKEERKVLSKIGAFVRTTARQSIENSSGNEVSEPGEPPLAHTKAIKVILFAYDASSRSVVIGPPLMRSGVAETIEMGGTGTLVDRKTGKSRTVRYEPRPFMGPAAEENRPLLPEMWRDAITK